MRSQLTYIMTTKRKRVVLSVEMKKEILEKLENGESPAEIARMYNVGRSTISGFKQQKVQIENYCGSSIKKTLMEPKNKEVDSAIHEWFVQVRGIGMPISGLMLCEKALECNKLLNGNPNFKGSSSWLAKFKLRHGIRTLDISGEKLSTDSDAAEAFKISFNELLIEEEYSLQNVYNADETGLFWKALPEKTLVSRREKSAPGRKMSKERVTALFCSNATGCHRLPVFMIGKSKQPRCFKNVNMKALPIVYKNQKNAWMDKELFADWFKTVFIPEIKKRQMQHGQREKTLLLLDNATSHFISDTSNEEDQFIIILFLPPNVTSLIQPMDQGVIESFKRRYRKDLIRKFLFGKENEDVIELHKKLNLKDCSYLIASAWSSITNITLERAWRKLLIHNESEEINEEEMLSADTTEIVSILHRIPGCMECNADDVTEWFRSNENTSFVTMNTVNNTLNSHIEQEKCDESDIEDVPSHSEAFEAIEKALRWSEKQTECNSTQLTVLKNLCDLAARKIWDP